MSDAEPGLARRVAGIAGRAIVLAFALIGFISLGRGVSMEWVEPFEGFERGSMEARVAAEARRTVLLHRDHPVQAIFGPQAKVLDVSEEPGSCDYPAEGHPQVPHRDWVATVRVHTLYGVPLRTYRVLCGGQRI